MGLNELTDAGASMIYDWNFQALGPYWKAIWNGFMVTCQLTGLTIAIGTVFGFALGIVLRSRIVPIRWPLFVLVDIIRSTPVLILLLTFNYFLPVLLGEPDMTPFTIALIGLSVNLSAFIGDVVRGAIEHVPLGEIQAARAVGLPEYKVLWRFTIPQVVKLCIPTLTLLYIAIAKNSALASVIAVYDLTHTANLIVTTQMRTLEVYVVVTAIYVAMILPFSLLARRLERVGVAGRSEL